MIEGGGMIASKKKERRGRGDDSKLEKRGEEAEMIAS
jgi:hypothetical protein